MSEPTYKVRLKFVRDPRKVQSNISKANRKVPSPRPSRPPYAAPLGLGFGGGCRLPPANIRPTAKVENHYQGFTAEGSGFPPWEIAGPPHLATRSVRNNVAPARTLAFHACPGGCYSARAPEIVGGRVFTPRLNCPPRCWARSTMKPGFSNVVASGPPGPLDQTERLPESLPPFRASNRADGPGLFECRTERPGGRFWFATGNGPEISLGAGRCPVGLTHHAGRVVFSPIFNSPIPAAPGINRWACPFRSGNPSRVTPVCASSGRSSAGRMPDLQAVGPQQPWR